MVQFIAEYTKYSKILGIYTLAIRIRQYSWWIQELLKNINSNIKKLKDKVNNIKKEDFFKDISEIKNNSNLLASELRTEMHYLKLIYFHDSAILHLQLRLLLNIYNKIKEKEKEIIDLKKKNKKEGKKILNHKLKQIQKEIGDLSKVDEAIIHSLKSFKVGFNKMLRRGFSIKTFTLLKERRISQKIKIKARKIKEIEEKRKNIMKKINIASEKEVKKITNLLEKEIKAVEKDVLYDRQLIKKLRNKNKHIESIIKHLGKKMFKLNIDRKNINEILLSINQPFKELDTSIDASLEKMFRNALRQLNRTVRISKRIA